VIAWSVILRRLSPGPARGMWLGGAAAWFVSQAIEALQWDGNRLIHEWTIVPEEILEMTGSLLWGLALLIALRTIGDRPEELRRASQPRRGGYRQRVRAAQRAGELTGAPVGRTPSGR
jgi:hypothetical protein